MFRDPDKEKNSGEQDRDEHAQKHRSIAEVVHQGTAQNRPEKIAQIHADKGCGTGGATVFRRSHFHAESLFKGKGGTKAEGVEHGVGGCPIEGDVAG